MPFTFVHAGKYRTEEKLKIQTYRKEKGKQHKIQQNKTTPVQSPIMTLGHDTKKGLILQYSLRPVSTVHSTHSSLPRPGISKCLLATAKHTYLLAK